MSVLAEVISSLEHVQLETIQKLLPQVKSRLDKLKVEVMDYINNVYVFSARSGDTDLVEKSRELCTDITTLQDNVRLISKDEIDVQSKEIQQYAEEIKECNIKVELISNVISIHEGLLKIQQLQAEKLFVQAIEEVIHLQNFIDNIPEDDKIDPIFELIRAVLMEKSSLLSELKNISQENVIIQDTTQSDGLKSHTVKIKHKNDIFYQALNALVLNNKEIVFVNNIANSFFNVFSSIINCRCKITTSSDNVYNVLTLTKVKETKKDNYKQVFENVHKILQYLSNNFQYDLENIGTTLSYIGEKISEDVANNLIKNCLSETIPNDADGLKQYSQVISEIETLQSAFKNTKFFAEDNNLLLDYANNIDVHFINKKCNKYLEKAKLLMQKDLHDIVEVGKPHDAKNPLEELMSNEFPQSSVSNSTIELLNLAEEMLKQITTSSDKSSFRLYSTLQNIFDIYGEIVNLHHKKLLQTIPQQVAIYYNNCMYISYSLSKWNEQYKENLPANVTLGNVLFKHQPLALKMLAEETFNNYMKLQVTQIEDTLKDLHLSNTKSLEKLDSNTEKCLRQCLRQNELLKTVWQKVLPYDVYNRTIGVILNTICKYIINVVVSIEDIFTEAAEQLVDVLKLVQTRGPKLFTDPNEIIIFVHLWGKFKEMVLILNSSLMDIDERWAEGKGPLSLHFKPEEVKSLIRALFQNNEKRDYVLAKIHF